MRGLNTSLRALLGQGLQSASRGQLLRVAEALLEEEPAAAAAIPAKLSTADGRYQRVTADMVVGSLTDITDDAWRYTRDQETDLVWTHVLGDTESGQPWEGSMKIAQLPRALGMTEDPRVAFEAPDIRQLLSIIDYERYDPAVNPQAFRGPYGWHWTKTLCKRNDGKPAEYAWAVDLDVGNTLRYHRSYHFRVRACCPSQLLGLR